MIEEIAYLGTLCIVVFSLSEEGGVCVVCGTKREEEKCIQIIGREN
jgi:hypothetical protein